MLLLVQVFSFLLLRGALQPLWCAINTLSTLRQRVSRLSTLSRRLTLYSKFLCPCFIQCARWGCGRLCGNFFCMDDALFDFCQFLLPVGLHVVELGLGERCTSGFEGDFCADCTSFSLDGYGDDPPSLTCSLTSRFCSYTIAMQRDLAATRDGWHNALTPLKHSGREASCSPALHLAARSCPLQCVNFKRLHSPQRQLRNTLHALVASGTGMLAASWQMWIF